MTDRVTIDDDVVEKDRLLQLKKKQEHDLKWELRQLRRRLDEDEMKIKQLQDDLANTKKNLLNIMMANEIALQVLNKMVDDVKVLKEGQK